MRKQSTPDNGRGGKRLGAGRKKTDHVTINLRLKPETLEQLEALRLAPGFTMVGRGRKRRIRYRISRSAIVVLAIAEKYERYMASRRPLKSLNRP